MIDELGANAYINSLPAEFESGLHFVHMAEIRFRDGPAPAFVKLFRPGCGGIANEAIGWLLSRACGTQVAPRAAILDLETRRVSASLPDWIEQGDQVEKAWVVERIDGKPLSLLQGGANDDQFWTEVLSHPIGPRLSAIDEWTSNNDRHAGNLIRDSRKSWHAIDFSELLGSHIWPMFIDGFGGGIIDHSPTELLRRAQYGLEGPSLDQFISRMIRAADNHYKAMRDHSTQIRQIVTALHGAKEAAVVSSFLSTRSPPDWMPKRLGCIG